MPTFSIIITNYNYKEYLPISIESAISQTVPCEIIVVDDGSTDGSQAIIASYMTNGIISIYREHFGQIPTVNAGFEASSGEIVMYLDSDDVLLPTAAEEITKVWYNGVAKAQFQMLQINGKGNSLNYVFPAFPANHSPAAIRRQVSRTGHYFWPPSSGNAYARRFLLLVMPLSPSRFSWASDGLLNTVAPLYGDIITLNHVLGQYRIHERSQQHSVSLASRISRNLGLMRRETEWLYEHADKFGQLFEINVFDEMRQLELRMASLLVCTNHQIPGDNRYKLLRLMIANFSDDSVKRRLGRMAWMVFAATAPPPLRERLVNFRFTSHVRQGLITRLFTIVGLSKHTT